MSGDSWLVEVRNRRMEKGPIGKTGATVHAIEGVMIRRTPAMIRHLDKVESHVILEGLSTVKCTWLGHRFDYCFMLVKCECERAGD